jgi:hypothetical protein
VAALVDFAQAGRFVTTADLIEAARGSPHEALYGEMAWEGIAGPADSDSARMEIAGIFAKLEESSIKQECTDLYRKPEPTDMERERLHELNRRLAELKGAPPVRGVSPS